MVKNIFQEYKIHNAHVTFRGDHDVDELIDVIEGNRKYIQCLYVYNKIDTISIEEVDMLARSENTAVLSSLYKLGASLLLDRIWDMLSLVRVYTKKVDSNSKPIEGMRSWFWWSFDLNSRKTWMHSEISHHANS